MRTGMLAIALLVVFATAYADRFMRAANGARAEAAILLLWHDAALTAAARTPSLVGLIPVASLPVPSGTGSGGLSGLSSAVRSGWVATWGTPRDPGAAMKELAAAIGPATIVGAARSGRLSGPAGIVIPVPDAPDGAIAVATRIRPG